MIGRIVGSVTESEKKGVETLFEHREALRSLVSSLSDEVLLEDDTLFDKYVSEMAEANFRYQLWWEQIVAKYNWEGAPGARWSINFNTNEVLLV